MASLRAPIITLRRNIDRPQRREAARGLIFSTRQLSDIRRDPARPRRARDQIVLQKERDWPPEAGPLLLLQEVRP
jgi:hypothetical protein